MIDPKPLDLNIRTILKDFFLNKVIKDCDRLSEPMKKRNCILIMDDRSTRVIDRFMTVVDLLECGILGMENLSKKRKKTLGFHAIYLIEPSEDSIRYMMSDFIEVDPKEKKVGDDSSNQGPLYDFVHIVFTSFVSDFDLQTLTKSKNLINAIISIRQINLDIFVLDENTFSIDFIAEDKLFTNEITPKYDKIIDDLSNRLLSVFTLLEKFENLQIVYQKGGIAENIGLEVQKKAQKILDICYTQKKNPKEGPAIHLLLLNRGFDMMSPFLRDSTYASMYYNLTPTHENLMNFEYEIEGKGSIVQTVPLNETDIVWRNYKYKPFVETMKAISENYQEFVKKNSSLSAKEKAGKTANELVDEIRAMPQYHEIIKDYSRHLNAMLKVVKNSKDSNFKYVFELEQAICTGKHKSGENFDEKDINIALISDIEERIRIGILLKYSLGWDSEKIGKIFQLDNDSKMRFKSLITLFEKGLINETYKIQEDEEASQNSPEYYKCPIVKILNLLTTNKLFGPNRGAIDIKLGRFNLYPKNSNLNTFERNNFKQTGLFPDKDKLPIVIVFVFGGIFYNEIYKMNIAMESKTYGDFKLICGGTGVYSPYSFLKKYNELNNERKIKAKKEREEKIRAQEEKERIDREKSKNALFDVLKPKVEEEVPDDTEA